uniref:Uncharacterized protein n=2 Tax=Oryza glaberrima TaxID=4538 RepID=I1NLR2_ORYGL
MSLTGHGGGGGEGTAPALELLDEYWFFSNTLGKNGRHGGGGGGGGRPPMLPRSPSTVSGGGGRPGKGVEAVGTSRLFASAGRRLLRTPSLPSPRVGMEIAKEDEEVVEEAPAAAGGGGDQEADAEDDDLNWSSIYEGVLRTRIAEEGVRSALRRAPSMPVTSSATGRDDDARREDTAAAATGSTTPGMSRLRHAHSTLERHCRSHTPTTKADRTPRTSGGGDGGHRRQPLRRELRSFSANQQPLVRHQSLFHDKKWKSSSDLESIEVQGFRDLGFVFDQEELRESLADVLPGLRGKPTPTGSGSASDNDDANTATTATGSDAVAAVRRPYLSEAWYHVRRPAPRSPAAAAMRLQQADARSAAEMKDQLRMWAQAVACNVRQEC